LIKNIVFLSQAQQKILENGGAVPNDDEITPTVMVQVRLVQYCHRLGSAMNVASHILIASFNH